MKVHIILQVFIFIFFLLIFPIKINAIYDPLSVPNNKFGIHIIQATPDESSPAASLVNSSGGDWGYITLLIESKDRNVSKWQTFFDDLRRRHLIPIVRLATQSEGDYWGRPKDGEETEWAGFLDKLNWPTKNRYISIYNEPNHAKEWGNSVDPKMYAEILDKTIAALKNKNEDFFVLNGGLDSSSPQKPPQFMDQVTFMREMQQAVPGIFEKLDGWVSHSYPQPNFSGSPQETGRETIRSWLWEMQILRELEVKRSLPIFITETGWKHAEGLSYNPAYPSAEKVSSYFKEAFEKAWSSSRVVAVTPFLLSYQQTPFDHFSFKKVQEGSSSDYYPQFQTVKEISKTKGLPIQEYKAQLIKGEIYRSIVAGEIYNIELTFKNTGQAIWNDRDPAKLIFLEGGGKLGAETAVIPKGVKIEPGKEYTFTFKIKAPSEGLFKIVLNLFEGNKEFESKRVEFNTEVKAPVILKVVSSLKWKGNFSGEYLLSVSGATGESTKLVVLNDEGVSQEVEARYLLPDYTFDFILEKEYYHPSTIRQTVQVGVNVLEFGELKPDFFSVLTNPQELWKLLPFSK